MTWIIIKQPHLLDSAWELASEAYSDANSALNALPSDASDEQSNAATDRLVATIHTLVALPARNISDCIIKLTASGVEDGDSYPGIDVREIINEMTCVLDAACQRGAHLKRDIPGLLEGVSFDAQ